MISRGVEISIAGVGEKMVRVLSLGRFFYYFYFYLPFYICLRYNSHVSASYVDKKPPTTVHPASPG